MIMSLVWFNPKKPSKSAKHFICREIWGITIEKFDLLFNFFFLLIIKIYEIAIVPNLP